MKPRENGFGATPEPAEAEPRVLEWGLGSGETAVISLALRVKATAVLDDAEARAAARVLGVSVIGTLGVVLQARLAGRIPSASMVIRELRDAGFRLDDTVIAEALARAVGELWDP